MSNTKTAERLYKFIPEKLENDTKDESKPVVRINGERGRLEEYHNQIPTPQPTDNSFEEEAELLYPTDGTIKGDNEHVLFERAAYIKGRQKTTSLERDIEIAEKAFEAGALREEYDLHVERLGNDANWSADIPPTQEAYLSNLNKK
jgi:hypothetical protein